MRSTARRDDGFVPLGAGPPSWHRAALAVLMSGMAAGERSLEGSEGLIGLGSYGKPVTVLTVPGLEERIPEREQLQGLWAPRCGRR